MADREDAAEQPVQRAASQTTVDHLVAEADCAQLATRYDAMLAGCDDGNRLAPPRLDSVPVRLVSHMEG